MVTGWTVLGLNPSEGEIFLIRPERPWGPHSLLYNGYRVFPGGKKRPQRDPNPSPPSNAVGHERVELYLYSTYGPYGLFRASVPVQGCTLPLPYSIAIPLLPLWAVRPVQSLSACTRVHFGFSCCLYVFFYLQFLLLHSSPAYLLLDHVLSLSILISLFFLLSLLLPFLSLFRLYCLSVSPSYFSTLLFTVFT
jgi:hypothetical protein